MTITNHIKKYLIENNYAPLYQINKKEHTPLKRLELHL